MLLHTGWFSRYGVNIYLHFLGHTVQWLFPKPPGDLREELDSTAKLCNYLKNKALHTLSFALFGDALNTTNRVLLSILRLLGLRRELGLPRFRSGKTRYSAVRTIIQRPMASNFQNLGYLAKKAFEALRSLNLEFQGAKH